MTINFLNSLNLINFSKHHFKHMKKVSLSLLALITILLWAAVPVHAQQKEDIIYLSDGQQKKGKIVSISDEVIKFSYTGEEVVYEMKKEKISKIVFANGREEVLSSNKTATPSNTLGATSQSNGNLVAVVPFEIASNDGSITNDGFRKKIQESCIAALHAQNLMVQYQDARTTNALLTKAGISFSEIGNQTPEDLAKILGVDYIVLGVYDIENKGASTHGSGISSYETKQKNEKEKGTAYSSNNSYTTISYNTKVHLSIYDANGRQLFSDSKSPLFGSLDSYNSALKSLAKRVPLKK